MYAEPFNVSALTIHWQPVQDTREAMRGRLKGYKVQYNTLITTLGELRYKMCTQNHSTSRH